MKILIKMVFSFFSGFELSYEQKKRVAAFSTRGMSLVIKERRQHLDIEKYLVGSHLLIGIMKNQLNGF